MKKLFKVKRDPDLREASDLKKNTDRIKPPIPEIQFIILIISAAILFLSCSESGNRIVYRGDGGRGCYSEKFTPPIGIKWKLKYQEGDARERHFNPPVVYKNTLFFGSSDSNFYALDINSGFMKWVFKTAAPVNSVPYVDSEKVYFGSSDGYVYAADIKSGNEIWRYNTDFPVNSTITGYEDYIILTTDTGSTHFLSKEGEELDSVPNYLWQYNSFQVYDDVVFFMPGPAEDPYSLGAYNIKERRFKWLFQTAQDNLSWYSFPAVSQNSVLFSACGLYGDFIGFEYISLDAETGEVLWNVKDLSNLDLYSELTPEDIFWENINLLDYMAPAVWKNNVIYAPGDRTMKSFKVKDGTKNWESVFDTAVSSAPSIGYNRIYIGLRGDSYADKAPMLVAVDAKSGRISWSTEIDGEILGSPVISGRWLIFGTDSNYLYVFEKLF